MRFLWAWDKEMQFQELKPTSQDEQMKTSATSTPFDPLCPRRMAKRSTTSIRCLRGWVLGFGFWVLGFGFRV